MRQDIDLEKVHALLGAGHSKAAIARDLGVPVSTLKDAINRALPVKATEVYKSIPTNVHFDGPTEVHNGRPTNVHIDVPIADMMEFQEVLAWWRRRKHLLGQANEAPAETERWTLHIERPFIERIKHEAESEHITHTELINRIIRFYYASGS
jgi:hypothetical protein